MLEDMYDFLFVDGPSRSLRREWDADRSPEAMLERQIAKMEVSGETGIPMNMLDGVSEYDERWGDVWARAYDIRKERGGEEHDPRDDQQAFKEVFGK